MQHRILIVDDEIAFLVPMQRMLSSAGLRVDTAETLEQALELLIGNRYDAVVADVRLGGALSREGLEVLRFIRAQGSDTRVIIMTGFGSDDVHQAALSLGADRYFEKPVSFITLSEALGRLGVLEIQPVL